MGAGASAVKIPGNTIEEKYENLLPDWIIRDAVLRPGDLDHTQQSWNHIIENTSPEFIRLTTQTEKFDYTSCKLWFLDQFFVLSAESGKMPSQLYNATAKIREGAINGMVVMLFSTFRDPTEEHLQETFRDLAAVHFLQRRVRCYQYVQVVTPFLMALKVRWPNSSNPVHP